MTKGYRNSGNAKAGVEQARPTVTLFKRDGISGNM